MRTERYFTLPPRDLATALPASPPMHTIHTECQYQGIVKVPGSFRPSAPMSIFTRTAISSSSWSRQWEVVTPFVQVGN